MTAVAGHECDQCHTIDVIPYHSMNHPQPKRGWHVQTAEDPQKPATPALWFCSGACVIKFMVVEKT